jgi:hypothetical protein
MTLPFAACVFCCCSKAQREAAAAQRAAEKSRKELQEVASQQLPRTKAEFQVGRCPGFDSMYSATYKNGYCPATAPAVTIALTCSSRPDGREGRGIQC